MHTFHTIKNFSLFYVLYVNFLLEYLAPQDYVNDFFDDDESKVLLSSSTLSDYVIPLKISIICCIKDLIGIW